MIGARDRTRGSRRGHRATGSPATLRTQVSGLRLVYVIGTYPVPTTTFIDREIAAIRRLGVDVELLSIRHPERSVSPSERTAQADVEYILPVPFASLLRSHATFLWTRPCAYVGTLAFLLSRRHRSMRTRIRTLLHFGVGVHVARVIRDGHPADHIHAHFVDRAAVVAMVAGRLLAIPFSATAHANDIYVDPVLLPEKLERAKFIATCTRYNERHLRAVAGTSRAPDIRCVYHGLDPSEYLPARRSTGNPPRLLAVGQLKEKKGFRYLLEACRILGEREIAFRCEIVGDGPLRSELTAMIERLRIGDHVELVGSLPHDAVMARYREAAIFVLPCVTDVNGDRDGIPNVILEAMASELPVVSTRHSGIPEAVEHGVTGLLVEPGDATALADALQRLLADPGSRQRLGRSGRRRVLESFDVDVNARELLRGFSA